MLSGNFLKRGTKFKFLHKRFVVLLNRELTIYKNDSRKKIEKIIKIDDNAFVSIKKESKKGILFKIENDDKSVTLMHKDPEVVNNWINEIQTIIQHSQINMACFDILSVLGRGFYGKVMLCMKKDEGKLFAIKTVHKDKLAKTKKIYTVFNERNILMNVKHPFIVDICYTFQTESKVYFVLEYVEGGTLYHHLRKEERLPIEEVKLYVAELCLAIDYLHKYGILYRDLKPENVMLDLDGHVKLTDFGLAKRIKKKKTLSFCGTTEYLSPEMVSGLPYGKKSDWWSLGILTYELLYGKTPFVDENKGKMYRSILYDDPEFSQLTDKVTNDFILSLLTKDEFYRPDFKVIRKHPFFNGINFDDVLNKKYNPLYKPSHNLKSNLDFDVIHEKVQDSTATPMINSAFDGFSMIASLDNNVNNDNYETHPPENSESEEDFLQKLPQYFPSSL